MNTNSRKKKRRARRRLLFLVVILLAVGYFMVHFWTDPTCTEPARCVICGKIGTAALDHDWTGGSCTQKQTCSRCGCLSESPLEHNWKAATYQDPRTCLDCGYKAGGSLSMPWEKVPLQTPTGIVEVSSGGWTTYVLTDWGKVYAVGRNQDGQMNISHLSGVVDIAAGDSHLVVLYENGTVDAIGRWGQGQCNVKEWSDIRDVFAGIFCSVGICEDGTVKLAGQSPYARFDASEWTNIVQVDASDHFLVGLRTDGTVVYAGGNGHEESADPELRERKSNAEEIAGWTDIIAVASGDYHTIGLRADGTVVSTTPESNEFPGACDVSGWTDIVSIAAGSGFSVGLRSDGTVVVAGEYKNPDRIVAKGELRDAESWTDIIQISATYNQIVGLRKDGQLVACGFNPQGQCDMEKLQEIVRAGREKDGQAAVPEARLKVSHSKMEFRSPNQTHTFKVSGSENGEYTWTSQDPSVARVDENGTVTSVGTGSTTIICRSGNLTAEIRIYCSWDREKYMETTDETYESFQALIQSIQKRIRYSSFSAFKREYCLGEYFEIDGRKALALFYHVPAGNGPTAGYYAGIWMQTESGEIICLGHQLVEEAAITDDADVSAVVCRLEDRLFLNITSHRAAEGVDITRSRYYAIGNQLTMEQDLRTEVPLISVAGRTEPDENNRSFYLNRENATPDAYEAARSRWSLQEEILRLCPKWLDGLEPQGTGFEGLLQ